MFVLASNHFRKCFSVNASVWLRIENKFSENAFQLTVCFSWFDLEMVWSENFHFKPFPNSCIKREREITPRSRHEPKAQSPSTLHPSTSPFNFDFELHPDRTLRLRRWTQSPKLHAFGFANLAPLYFAVRLCRWTQSRGSHAFDFTDFTPFDFADFAHLRLHQDRTPISHRSHWDRNWEMVGVRTIFASKAKG